MSQMMDAINTLTTGVYWLPTYPDVGEQELFLAQNAWKCYFVHGSDIHSTQQMLDTFQVIMESPDYCNNNFDAFRDCVRSLPWYAGDFRRYIIFYDNIDVFAQKSRKDFDLAIHDVFIRSTEDWSKGRKEQILNVLLFGDQSVLPDGVTLIDN